MSSLFFCNGSRRISNTPRIIFEKCLDLDQAKLIPILQGVVLAVALLRLGLSSQNALQEVNR
jgi:hypothetical protein